VAAERTLEACSVTVDSREAAGAVTGYTEREYGSWNRGSGASDCARGAFSGSPHRTVWSVYTRGT